MLITCAYLFSHEGHNHHEAEKENVNSSLKEELATKQFSGRPQNWSQWIGGFHFIFLHFPIALITMATVSELFFVWNPKPLFDQAARFMLIAAAILAIPTVISGLIYSYAASYEGLMSILIEWHMWLGIATAALAIVVAFIRERKGKIVSYYISLFLLFLLVNITGFLGGEMTLGPYHMLPPN